MIKLALGWVAAIGLIALFAHRILLPAPAADYTGVHSFGGTLSYLTSLVRFDALHYLSLAADGYQAHPQLAAFFPLWPLLIAATALPLQLVVAPDTARLIVAAFLPAALLLAALPIIRRLLAHDEPNPAVATTATLALLAFPYAFFYLAPYTESLFLLLLATALLAARQRRWWLAGLAAALATATRLPAVVLCAALLVEYLHQFGWDWRRLRPDILWLALTPVGTAAYFAYLQFGLGSWHLYAQSYHLGWPERVFNPNPLHPFIAALQTQPTSFNTLAAVAVFALAVGLLVAGWRRLRPSDRLLCLGFMLIPLLTTTLDSLPRYYMLLLPLYLVAARLLTPRPTLLWGYLYLGGLLAGLLAALFTSGYFIA